MKNSFRCSILSTLPTLFGAIMLVACGGAEPTGQARLAIVASSGSTTASSGSSYAASDQAGPVEMVDASDATFAVSSAKIYLRHIQLDLPDGKSCDDVESHLKNATCDDGSNKINIEGPFVVDLVTKKSTPNLGDVSVPAGIYKRIDFRVDDGKVSDGLVEEGDVLDDRSFALVSTFDLDGTPTTLRLSLRFNEDIRIEEPGGVEVGGEEDLITTFVARSWLSGVDIRKCIADDSIEVVKDEVVIDDGTVSGGCSQIENTIKNNMKKSAQLGGA